MKTLWQVFRAPLAFGLMCLTGLLAALLGDGAWDGASWLLLGAVCAATIYYWHRAPRTERRAP